MRHILRNPTYIEGRDGSWQETAIERERLVQLLRHVFGLDIAESARFSALDGGA